MTTDQTTARGLPRALRPFRNPAYRRLALALVLSTFGMGVWVVGLVWEVIRIGGGAAQLSIVSTAGAIGVMLPALIAGVVADRVPQKTILIGVSLLETRRHGAIVAVLSLTGHDRALAPHRRLVHGRCGPGVLLPGLHRLAAGAGGRGRPDGGQRLRGDGPPDHRQRRRSRSGGRRGRRRVARRGDHGRSRGLRGQPGGPAVRPEDTGTPRARRSHRRPSGPHRAAPTWPRASATWSARPGCWRRCCSPP